MQNEQKQTCLYNYHITDDRVYTACNAELDMADSSDFREWGYVFCPFCGKKIEIGEDLEDAE